MLVTASLVYVSRRRPILISTSLVCGRMRGRAILYMPYHTHHCNRTSCHIDKLVLVMIIPPHVLLLHQPIDPLFDHAHLGHKVALDRLDRLRLERLVMEFLFGFHDADDRSVEVMLAVRVDVRLCAFRLFGLRCVSERVRAMESMAYRILCLDGVDVDLCPRIRKVGIEVEHVVVVDVFSHRSFPEDFFVRTCQTLKGPFELSLVWCVPFNVSFCWPWQRTERMTRPFWWPLRWPCIRSPFPR